MKRTLFIGLLLSSTMAFAAHPASDRVHEMLDEAARIHEMNGSAKEQAVCRFIGDYLEVASIATRILGSYGNHADKAGVAAFKAASRSLMATKIMPELKKLTGAEGSYTVSPDARSRSGGMYAVGVRAVVKGKTYNATMVLSAVERLYDAEYLGFSGVSHAGRKVRGDIDKKARTSKTPIADYVADLKNDKDYVGCR